MRPARPAPRPVLIFDGDCGMCTTSARLLARRLRRHEEDFAVEPWQSLDLTAYGLTPTECDEAVQWVGADGSVASGENAVSRALLACRRPLRPLGAVILAPGINRVARRAYRWVAANRERFPGGTPACALPPPG